MTDGSRGRVALGQLFYQRREKGTAGLPVLAVTIDRGVVRRDSLPKRRVNSLNPSEHIVVRRGDIAYNTMRMWQGACGIAREDGLVSPAYVVCSPREGVCAGYFAQLFHTPRMTRRFEDYAYGLTADRLRLYFRDFARIKVEVPPYPEQRARARVLDLCDRCIELAGERLLRQIELRDVLIGDLLLERLRLPGFSAPWESANLSDLVGFFSGGTPRRDEPANWGGSIPWFTARDLGPIRLTESCSKVTSDGVRSGSRIAPAGTVLMLVRGMTLLKDVPIGITKVDAAFNQDLKALVCGKKLQPEFLALALIARRPALRRLVDRAGHGTGRIQTEHLRDLAIRFPALSEQEAVVRAVEVALRETELVERQLELFKKQKRGLMQKLLTGQIRVKV